MATKIPALPAKVIANVGEVITVSLRRTPESQLDVMFTIERNGRPETIFSVTELKQVLRLADQSLTQLSAGQQASPSQL